MGAVVPLRQPPPRRQPEPAPERERLAIAIERHNAVAERLAGIQAALPKAELVWEVRGAVKLAEEALAEARTTEPRRIANQLIGEPLDAGGLSVDGATAALTKATAAQESAVRTREALQSEADAAERALADARRDRDQEIATIAAIVATSPAVAKLLAENDATR